MFKTYFSNTIILTDTVQKTSSTSLPTKCLKQTLWNIWLPLFKLWQIHQLVLPKFYPLNLNMTSFVTDYVTASQLVCKSCLCL